MTRSDVPGSVPARSHPHGAPRNRGQRLLITLAPALALPVLVGSGVAEAETTFIPYVSSTTSYDTNIYRVTDKSQVPVVQGKQVDADFIFNNAVGVDASYLLAQQRFFVKAEGSRFNYLNIPSLNQNAYNYGGGLDWTLFGRIKGTLSGTEVKTRASFADRDTTRLNTQQTTTLGATTAFLLTNDVNFNAGYNVRILQTPARNAPTLRLDERTSSAAINYIGINRLSAGITGSYTTSNYRGTAENNRFKQYSGGTQVQYVASDISNFALTLGYSKRQGASGVTGGLNYRRELTGKTSANFAFLRAVESFDAGDNSIISTGGSAGLVWAATSRIETTLNYSYTDSVFRDATAAPTDFTGRRDQAHAVNLGAAYEVRDWLVLSPLVTYARRDSNVPISNYDGFVFSMQVRAQWK